MSKYIRTKNGIYEVIKNELGDLIKIDGGFVMLEDVRLIEQNIIESDTIEELCNAIVYYDCDLKCVQVIWLKGKNVANFKRHFDYVKMGLIKDVKGAILTDKGLIYVAEMNEIGELVLI